MDHPDQTRAPMSFLKVPPITDRVYCSWELNIPKGPCIKGGDFYDADYPLTQEGLDDIKDAAARRATDLVRPMAATTGAIIQPLPPQFVTIICVIPAQPHTRQ